MAAQLNIELTLPILITSAQHQELQTAMLAAGQRDWQVNRMVNRPPKRKLRPTRRHKTRSLPLACEML